MKVIVKLSSPLSCGCYTGQHLGRSAGGEVQVGCLFRHIGPEYVPESQVSDWGEKRVQEYRALTQAKRNAHHQGRMTGVPYDAYSTRHTVITGEGK